MDRVSSPDAARRISESESNGRPTADLSDTSEPPQEATPTSRFIRKKTPVTGVKRSDDELPTDSRGGCVLPAVDDAAQREHGTGTSLSAAKKTYSVNLSGAAVPSHRAKKSTVAQTSSHINTAAVKGSPLAERKTKVQQQQFAIFADGDHLRVGKSFRYVASPGSQPGQLSLPSLQGQQMCPSLAGKAKAAMVRFVCR